jgi:predicted dehydrogenase
MGGGVLDTAAAVLETKGGLMMSLVSSYVTSEIYYFRVYGTNGHLILAPYSLKLETLHPSKTVEMSFSDEGSESYVLEMREFAQCIRSGKKPETDGIAGLRAVQVLEKMLFSVKTGKVSKITDSF